jgi:hypothetical protein
MPGAKLKKNRVMIGIHINIATAHNHILPNIAQTLLMGMLMVRQHLNRRMMSRMLKGVVVGVCRQPEKCRSL